MHSVETRSTYPLSTQEQKLLLLIKNHEDGGKGYLLPLEAMVGMGELNQVVVAQWLATLLDAKLITESAYKGAYQITQAGRHYLIEDTSGAVSETEQYREAENRGWWDRFSGWFVLQFLARYYRE